MIFIYQKRRLKKLFINYKDKEVLKKESLDPKVRESVEKRLKHIENDTTIFK